MGPLEEVRAALEIDLCLTRLDLVAAQGRLRTADTAANRAAVARCRARVDVVVDLLVELDGDARSRQAGRPGARRDQSLLDPPGRPSRM